MARIAIAWRYGGRPAGALLYLVLTPDEIGSSTKPEEATTFPNHFRALRYVATEYHNRAHGRENLRTRPSGLIFPDLDADPCRDSAPRRPPRMRAPSADENPYQHWQTGQFYLFLTGGPRT